MKRSLGCLFLIAAVAATPRAALADDAPAPLSLADAVKLARTRGFDVLVASAQIHGAEADVQAAGATPNPLASGGVGRTFACGQGSCNGSQWGFYAGLSDQGLLEGALTRKRALREDVASRAVDAAKYGRADAERVLVAQTKIQYVLAAAAAARLDFARDVSVSLAKALEVTRARYPKVIDEGQLARVEQEVMKADQEVARAQLAYREQQIGLALLIAAPGAPPEVDKKVLELHVPDALASSTKEALLRSAIEARPDRRQAIARESQGEAAIASASRQRIPDISLYAQYTQQGTADYATTLPTLTFGAQLPIPLFYQQQGEIQRAQADRELAATQRRRIEATLAAEIDTAHARFTTAREIVQRYESGLLDRAKRARQITQVQWDAGAGSLTDLLDAQRSFVQVNSDYYSALASYWTAVFQLEQATARPLTP